MAKKVVNKPAKTKAKVAQKQALMSRNMFAFVLVFALVGGTIIAVSNAARKDDGTGGNGAPNGAHYNLNVIGVPKDKTATITSGNRIFVDLEGNCRVNLEQGDFAVVDGNCTDGQSRFSLPNPDPDGDGVTTYSVWARPVGKPGGKATATTCGVDPITLEEMCSLESTAFVRSKGKSSFENVSKGFLTVYVDLDGDPTTPAERLSIFDPLLQDYFWSYDNNGLRVLQLRFYERSTDVNS